MARSLLYFKTRGVFMKKNFIRIAFVSGISALLLSGCGMTSKDRPAKTETPSAPAPEIKTEAVLPVIVEKPILPILEPFDLIVHRVKDTVTIKIKKSVELPSEIKDHRLVIKRHKIGDRKSV